MKLKVILGDSVAEDLFLDVYTFLVLYIVCGA